MVYLSARASSFSLIARSLLDFSCRSPSVSNWISVSNLKNRVRESKSNFKVEIDFEKGYMAWSAVFETIPLNLVVIYIVN